MKLARMRNACGQVVVVGALLAGCRTGARLIPDGKYYGYEPTSNLTPHEPDACWFHENVLTVKGSVIRIETYPKTEVGTEVTSSASTGGFYTFEGSQTQLGGRTVVALRLFGCDYCPIDVNDPPPSKRRREYIVSFGDAGELELDRVVYRRTRHPTCYPGPLTTR